MKKIFLTIILILSFNSKKSSAMLNQNHQVSLSQAIKPIVATLGISATAIAITKAIELGLEEIDFNLNFKSDGTSIIIPGYIFYPIAAGAYTLDKSINIYNYVVNKLEKITQSELINPEIDAIATLTNYINSQ